MIKLSVNIAKKVLKLMDGETIPYGQLKSEIIDQMIDDGILNIKLQGRSRKTLFTAKPEVVANFLNSHLGINDLNTYINNVEKGVTRAENIIASSDSKLSTRRTFKGFLVNCFSPVKAKINSREFVIGPQEGTFTYIHDFEGFIISPDTLIIGVENPENFRLIRKQKQLFDAKSILFVSRYPQSKDLVTWLQGIPNEYMHFGDFDFEGVRIFRDEYYKNLKGKASYFIPEKIEELISRYGNKKLYDNQYKSITSTTLNINDDIEGLMSLFHKYKKCLEQEVLIKI